MTIRYTAADGSNSALAEKQLQQVKPPPLFRVLLLNDDYTPMDFVVLILQQYFGMNYEAAIQVMMKIHLDGKGTCGVYTHDIASTKVDLVKAHARQAGHPLQCVMEET